jgi:hypothetical protein
VLLRLLKDVIMNSRPHTATNELVIGEVGFRKKPLSFRRKFISRY